MVLNQVVKMVLMDLLPLMTGLSSVTSSSSDSSSLTNSTLNSTDMAMSRSLDDAGTSSSILSALYPPPTYYENSPPQQYPSGYVVGSPEPAAYPRPPPPLPPSLFYGGEGPDKPNYGMPQGLNVIGSRGYSLPMMPPPMYGPYEMNEKKKDFFSDPATLLIAASILGIGISFVLTFFLTGTTFGANTAGIGALIPGLGGIGRQKRHLAEDERDPRISVDDVLNIIMATAEISVANQGNGSTSSARDCALRALCLRNKNSRHKGGFEGILTPMSGIWMSWMQGYLPQEMKELTAYLESLEDESCEQAETRNCSNFDDPLVNKSWILKKSSLRQTYDINK